VGRGETNVDRAFGGLRKDQKRPLLLSLDTNAAAYPGLTKADLPIRRRVAFGDGFDDERGKGDHRHDQNGEVPSCFDGIDRSLSDCVDAVETWRNDQGLLTPKRYELLRHLRRAPETGIRALAHAPGRDDRRVHEDVLALAEPGLVERGEDGSLSRETDAIVCTLCSAA